VGLTHDDTNDKRPWDVFVTHTTMIHNGTKSIAIVATIIPPMINDTAALNPPPAGYEKISDFGYYKIYKNRRNWLDAMKTCVNDGANLLILNSKQEALEMKTLMKEVGTEKLWHWVGIHDHYKEGEYITIFSEPLSSTGYSDWYQGQPDGRNLQNCIYFSFSRSSAEYGLGDVDCNSKGPFICKKQIS
ncbi:hypothetical protein L9F63_019837, partial [Diploptera punctata]